MFCDVLLSQKLFDKWTDLLIDQSYDWKQIGISNDHCNEISIPNFGLELLNWNYRAFNIIDEKKYAVFLLRYQ